MKEACPHIVVQIKMYAVYLQGKIVEELKALRRKTDTLLLCHGLGIHEREDIEDFNRKSTGEQLNGPLRHFF